MIDKSDRHIRRFVRRSVWPSVAAPRYSSHISRYSFSKRHQFCHSDRIVSSCGYACDCLVYCYTLDSCLAHTRDAFQPSEYFFYPFTFPSAYLISFMPSRPPIQPRNGLVCADSYMRPDVKPSQAQCKVTGKVAFISTDGFDPLPTTTTFTFNQVKCTLPLCGTCRSANGNVNVQTVTVFVSSKSYNFLQQTMCDFLLHQTVTVLGKHAMFKRPSIQIHVKKPSKMNVVVKHVAKKAFRNESKRTPSASVLSKATPVVSRGGPYGCSKVPGETRQSYFREFLNAAKRVGT
jgi:hypothetical protein